MSAPAPRYAARRAARPLRSPAWWALTLGAVAFLVIGLGALGWSVYELLLNPPVDQQASAQQRAALRQAWESGATASPTVQPGEAVALLRIPRLGDDFEQVVLAGTAPAVLRRGLGWYDGTAAPGEIGNFAVAGLRGTRGPFAALGDLRAGDQVIVETRTSVYTYELTNNPAELTVRDTDTWVIQPVPGRPEVKPTEALITLTTSQALFRSDDRTVAFGRLVSAAQK